MSDLKNRQTSISLAECALRLIGVDTDALASLPTPRWVVELAEADAALKHLSMQFAAKLDTYFRGLEAKHQRASLRLALQRRTQWRKPDLAHLRTHPGARVSERRAARMSTYGRGRGVVEPYQSLPAVLAEMGNSMLTAFGPDTTKHVRIAALKRTTLWKGIAERYYRGCLAEAQASGITAPSTHAEERAAAGLFISPAKLHLACTEVRRRNRGELPLPLITPADFERWCQSGVLP